MDNFKPLAVSLPYPSVEGIEKNTATGVAVGSSYAGKHSELTAVLQYIYHSLFFENAGDKKTAELLKKIAISEMTHVELLAKTIKALGVDPVYGVYTPFGADYYKTSAVAYSNTVETMLLDDILGEMMAIKGYNELLSKVCDEKVTAIIKRIILDEELHLSALKERQRERTQTTCL